MKKLNRILALLLVCVLTVTFVSMGVSAEKEAEKPYDRIICFGDSNTRGLGIADTHCIDTEEANGHKAYDNYYIYSGYSIHGMENSFMDKIADALVNPVVSDAGITDDEKLVIKNSNRFSIAFQGETLSAALGLFGLADAEDDVLLSEEHTFGRNYYDKMQYFFGDEGCIVSSEVEKVLGNGSGGLYPVSDLIQGNAIEAKTANTYYSQNEFIAGGKTISNPAIEAVEKDKVLIVIELGMADTFYRALELSDGNFNKILSSAGNLAKWVSDLNEGYNYVVKNYTTLLEKIRKLNPEADIVIMSAFNVFEGIGITKDIQIELGGIFNGLINRMNLHYTLWAKKYGCTYADITDTPTPGKLEEIGLTDSAFTGNPNYYLHPDKVEGVNYMSNQVIEPVVALNSKISADISALEGKKIVSVMVNRKIVKDYEQKDNLLTVSYGDDDAYLLTVIYKDSVLLRTVDYSLDYQDGIYQVTEVQGIKGLYSIVKQFNRVLAGKISGLF